ncbi:MAG TPA: alanine--tRNA ligase-related protein, partial [Candidatus Polarisedimenticolia bacterium]|nr:alanine--tRNA ligase-related protein [Candidatus Polarisedimenticolia bacterium]
MSPTSDELRRTFLDFFVERGHPLRPQAPLVPLDDPTLLFTSAGMVQFKPYFSSPDPPPFRRAATVQRCLRLTDVENVGLTVRHATFFEMLGNFSFGEYFKEDAIAFAWEFVTSKEFLGLDPERLRVTVHYTDDEARAHWREIADLPDSRIYSLGDKDNFWQMGDTGPCGPCSEIYVDLRGGGRD